MCAWLPCAANVFVCCVDRDGDGRWTAHTHTDTHYRRDRTLWQVSGRRGSLRWHTFSPALTLRQNLAHIGEHQKPQVEHKTISFSSVLSKESVLETIKKSSKCKGCLQMYWHIDRSDEGHRLISFLFDTPTILVRALFVFPVSWQKSLPWNSSTSIVLSVFFFLDTHLSSWG